jgi:hypothetical protein
MKILGEISSQSDEESNLAFEENNSRIFRYNILPGLNCITVLKRVLTEKLRVKKLLTFLLL